MYFKLIRFWVVAKIRNPTKNGPEPRCHDPGAAEMSSLAYDDDHASARLSPFRDPSWSKLSDEIHEISGL